MPIGYIKPAGAMYNFPIDKYMHRVYYMKHKLVIVEYYKPEAGQGFATLETLSIDYGQN